MRNTRIDGADGPPRIEHVIGNYARHIDGYNRGPEWHRVVKVGTKTSPIGPVIDWVVTDCGKRIESDDLLTADSLGSIADAKLCDECKFDRVAFPAAEHHPGPTVPLFTYLHLGAELFSITPVEFSGIDRDMSRVMGWDQEGPFWLAKVQMVNGYTEYKTRHEYPRPTARSTAAGAMANGCEVAINRWILGERTATDV